MSDRSILSKTKVQLVTGISLLVISIVLIISRSVARMLISLITNGTAPHNVFIIGGLFAMFVSGIVLIIVSINSIKKS